MLCFLVSALRSIPFALLIVLCSMQTVSKCWICIYTNAFLELLLSSVHHTSFQSVTVASCVIKTHYSLQFRMFHIDILYNIKFVTPSSINKAISAIFHMFVHLIKYIVNDNSFLSVIASQSLYLFFDKKNLYKPIWVTICYWRVEILAKQNIML